MRAGTSAAQRWREQLALWAIPQRFTDSVPESPWQPPVSHMARRADEQIAKPGGESFARAAEALASPGSVLDVGAGGGAASLPLAGRITQLIAIDENPAMLDDLVRRAAQLAIPVRRLVGRWPEVADQVSTVDLVLCYHVFYNVPDLADFALALHRPARRRVVVELSARHSLWVLNPYWQRMHGIDRPDGPTADDAVAVLREAGLAPNVVRWRRPATPRSFEERLESTARAVCVPAHRRAELAQVMRDIEPVPREREVVTLWWDC